MNNKILLDVHERPKSIIAWIFRVYSSFHIKYS